MKVLLIDPRRRFLAQPNLVAHCKLNQSWLSTANLTNDQSHQGIFAEDSHTANIRLLLQTFNGGAQRRKELLSEVTNEWNCKVDNLRLPFSPAKYHFEEQCHHNNLKKV